MPDNTFDPTSNTPTATAVEAEEIDRRLGEEDPTQWEAPSTEAPPPAEESDPALDQGEQVPGEQPPTSTQALLAGRFRSQEDLEEGYRQLQGHQTRTWQENQALAQRTAQLEQALQQAYPIVQQALAQQQAPAGQPPPLQIDLDDPEKLPQVLDQLVERRVKEQLGQFTQQFQGQQQQAQQAAMQQAQAQQWQQAVVASIQQFRSTHPGVDGVTEDRIRETVQAFRMDPSDPEQLDLAYEVVQNPLVGRNLAANPHWAASREGREMARTLGAAPVLAGSPAGNGAPRRSAHVETGPSGAPVTAAPGARPGERDPIKRDILAEWEMMAAEPNVFYQR